MALSVRRWSDPHKKAPAQLTVAGAFGISAVVEAVDTGSEGLRI